MKKALVEVKDDENENDLIQKQDNQDEDENTVADVVDPNLAKEEST